MKVLVTRIVVIPDEGGKYSENTEIVSCDIEATRNEIKKAKNAKIVLLLTYEEVDE